MKNNVVSLLCAAALICGGFCSMPETGISTFAAEIVNSGTCGENLTWKLDDEGTLTISGEGDMTAYSTPATRYEASPFERSDAIRKVVILDGVTSIASFAFLKCTNLTAVSLPDSLVSIDDDAFACCTELIKIDLPKNLNSIGRYVFTCSGLTEITIPSSVTEIGAGAFSDCKSLTNINVSADNQAFTSQDGVLFDKAKTVLLCCPQGIALDTYTVSDTVTEIDVDAFKACVHLKEIILPDSLRIIGGEAFNGCSGLTSIVLPEYVESIGYTAFGGCTNLTSVTIPQGVTSIANFTFLNCSSLSSVSIPDSVTKIGVCAFENCGSLTAVTIPESVTSIDDSAFTACSSLTEVRLPDSLKVLGYEAFSLCSSLKEVTIPAGVTSVGKRPFVHCTALSAIHVDPDNAKYTSQDGVLFDKDMTLLLQYPAGSTTERYTVPESVTEIYDSAFCDAAALIEIVFPNKYCKINYDYPYTIPESATIIGWSGSSAHGFAVRLERNFIDIETLAKIQPGDINDDGAFNISDVVLLQKWLLAVPDTNLANWKAADFCNDHKLNAVDLSLMKQALLMQTVADYVEPDEHFEYGVPFYVRRDGLKLYLGPDESYEAVASIPADTRLIEKGVQNGNNDWLFTEYNGQYGWINTLDSDGKMVIYFEEAPKKPVIYLYPEQETTVHVELELTEDELHTTYPKYDSGWDVVAYPDGTLLNKADGSHHRYLFWDAVNCRTRFDFSKGFCVAGSDTERFLKEKLTYMGLTEQEMNEYIVYWLPLMEHNAYNLISFQGEAYTNSAKLTITPTPDNECRIFMAYVPLENAVEIEPQQLEAFERKGFTVVEWGGVEILS